MRVVVTAGLPLVIGRAGGLVWMLVVTAQLGYSATGTYAIAVGLASFIAVFADSAFHPRSLRLPDADFARDQRFRRAVGLGLLLLGTTALVLGQQVVGYAAAIAGAEVCFGSLKSPWRRVGRVSEEQLSDSLRQLLSVSAGVAALLWCDVALQGAMIAYLCGYLPVVVASALGKPSFRLPGVSRREWATLTATAVAGAAYLQLDVVLIGSLADRDVAGQYALSMLCAMGAASVAQQLANSEIATARTLQRVGVSRELTRNLLAGMVLAIVMLLGVVLLERRGLVHSILPAVLVLTLFVVLRSGLWWITLLLMVTGRDAVRLRGTLVALGVRILGVTVVSTAGLGVVGYVTGAVLSEAVLMAVYMRFAGGYRDEE